MLFRVTFYFQVVLLLCCENIHVHDKRTKVKQEISISGVWLMFEGPGELKTAEGIGACWA